jgi:hypothetical protein
MVCFYPVSPLVLHVFMILSTELSSCFESLSVQLIPLMNLLFSICTFQGFLAFEILSILNHLYSFKFDRKDFLLLCGFCESLSLILLCLKVLNYCCLPLQNYPRFWMYAILSNLYPSFFLTSLRVPFWIFNFVNFIFLQLTLKHYKILNYLNYTFLQILFFQIHYFWFPIFLYKVCPFHIFSFSCHHFPI